MRYRLRPFFAKSESEECGHTKVALADLATGFAPEGTLCFSVRTDVFADEEGPQGTNEPWSKATLFHPRAGATPHRRLAFQGLIHIKEITSASP